jgi:hypothetical protein
MEGDRRDPSGVRSEKWRNSHGRNFAWDGSASRFASPAAGRLCSVMGTFSTTLTSGLKSAWRSVIAFTVFGASVCLAQPQGKVDALFYCDLSTNSTLSETLYWLRPDGTYVQLYSGFVTGALAGVSSGATGTYTLVPDPLDPRKRDFSVSGGITVVIDFDTMHIVGYSVFRWADHSAVVAMANTSTRAFATTANPAIAGFVIAGTSSRWVLVRGIGPGLSVFNVEAPLSDPKLTVYQGPNDVTSGGLPRGPRLIEGMDYVYQMVGAFPLEKTSTDRSWLLYLAPGAYTAQTMPNGTSAPGTTLTEVYILPYGG